MDRRREARVGPGEAALRVAQQAAAIAACLKRCPKLARLLPESQAELVTMTKLNLWSKFVAVRTQAGWEVGVCRAAGVCVRARG